LSNRWRPKVFIQCSCTRTCERLFVIANGSREYSTAPSLSQHYIPASCQKRQSDCYCTLARTLYQDVTVVWCQHCPFRMTCSLGDSVQIHHNRIQVAFFDFNIQTLIKKQRRRGEKHEIILRDTIRQQSQCHLSKWRRENP
jgi:hypothetical protein